MQSSTLVLGPGEWIYRAGESADCAYIILRGSVALYRDSNGEQTRLTTLHARELFGEDGLINEKPRNTGAQAVETTELRRIDGVSISDTVHEDPEAAIMVLKVMLERLRGGKRLRPRRVRHGATLKALTTEAEAALGSNEVLIDSLPCRIGRASNDPLGQNEIQLHDQKPFQVSRSHLVLSEESGRIVVYDRGSSLGTWVRGQCLGGPSAFDGPVILSDEPSEMVLGHSSSPLRFSLTTVAIEGEP
ncbi:MAG: cyclic nucleotide-binding domain-containing protein [Cyanobium sp.]|nr:cyclic nucleotide-binding domain-containing protein [Cyanobium sp.]